jgi:hypothetical protein
MIDKNPFIHTVQREIDDLRAQAALLPPGRKRNLVLAKADGLEVAMKTFSWATSTSLQPPHRDAD